MKLSIEYYFYYYLIINILLLIYNYFYYYQLLLHKYVVTYRGVRYVSNIANFELTDINDIFTTFLGGLIN